MSHRFFAIPVINSWINNNESFDEWSLKKCASLRARHMALFCAPSTYDETNMLITVSLTSIPCYLYRRLSFTTPPVEEIIHRMIWSSFIKPLLRFMTNVFDDTQFMLLLSCTNRRILKNATYSIYKQYAPQAGSNTETVNVQIITISTR